jgi:hypothetical protein
MNIREVIDERAALAREMPDGEHSEVRVALCDGSNIEITRALEIDTMAMLTEAGVVREQFAVVKAHPHLDDSATVGRGVAEDADEQMRKWTEDG